MSVRQEDALLVLPLELDQRCSSVFISCDEFDSLRSLRAVFITPDLAPFVDQLPLASSSKKAFVDEVKLLLLRLRLADGRPLLLPFLQALHGRYGEHDALHGELSELYRQVSAHLEQVGSVLTETPAGWAGGPEAFPLQDTLPDPGPLPPGARLPFPRNALFTGRVLDLLEIAKALFYDQTVPLAVTQAIAGLGGVGKTQLAAELCYRYGRFTRGVHWLDAAGTSEQNNIDAEIAACGLAMNLPAWPQTQPEQVAATLAAWGGDPFRLVVLDNLEDPALLAQYLPRLSGLRLLVTTRRGSWPRTLGVTSRSLGVLTRPESLALLRALAEPLAGLPDDGLDPIAARFGDLPLGLHVAGSYIQESGLSPEGYLAALERRGGALHPSQLPEWARSSPTGHELDLAATFSLSWERLDSEEEFDRLARMAFRMAGFCAPNIPIPTEIFRQALALEDEAAPDLALRRLEALGLAELAQGGPRLHPLLSEFARHLDAVETNSALPALADALAWVSKSTVETGLPQNFVGLRPHLPIVAQAAEQAGLKDAGALWNNLGLHEQDVANYAGAKVAIERAIVIGEKLLGADSTAVAIRVNNLGNVLHAQGDLSGARVHYERALRIDEAALSPDLPNIAHKLNNLGLVLRDLGDLPGARAYLEQALGIDEAIFGPDNPEVATNVSNLGIVLRDLGDLPGARARFERALAIRQKTLEDNHPDTAGSLWWLGVLHLDQGETDQAREYFEKALAIYEATLPPDHPYIRDVKGGLASLQE